MAENGGYMGGLGAPGEKQIGKRDIQSEGGIPVAQGGIRILVDFVAFLAAILFAFTLGGIGIWLALSALAFLYTDYVTERLGKIARNARIAAIIYSAETWFPWLVFFAGLPLLRLVLPYQWGFDFETQRHFIYTKCYEPGYGMTWKAGHHFSLLLRAILAALPVAYFFTTGILRRRFKNELDSFAPLRAIDPTAKGSDPRDWTPDQEQAATHTVRIETVVRGNPENVGKGVVYPGDQIVNENVGADRDQWEAVTRFAYRDRFPTEEQATANSVFSQSEWRTFRAGLVAAKLTEQAGNGGHGANAGYRFTEAGLDFFRNKRWEKRR